MQGKENNDNSFTVLENKTIGRNFSRFRKFREKKAFEVADYIGIGEAAYTKYERGESKITIEIIQKVAEYLSLDPITLLTTPDGNIVDNGNNSPFAINGTVNTTNEIQNQAFLTLVENVVEMNKRIMELLEKKL
jgi:transcriptional regulator with XRE-family HTH domain